MKTKTLYLAGPIEGLTWEDASFGWREEVYNWFKLEWHQAPPDDSRDDRGWCVGRTDTKHIDIVSPMRGFDFLKGKGEINTVKGDYHKDHVIGTNKAITFRDLYDVRSADAILANFLGAKQPTRGTLMEISYAFAKEIPVITVIEKDNPNNHPFLDTMSTYVTEDLEEGCNLAWRLLTPGL